MAGNVLLKDIAEKSGLSVSTVSQILNNKPNNYSSEATRQRVRDLAAEMGYKTNFGYKLMRGQATQTVAIIASMPHKINEEHIRNLVMNLMLELDNRGYGTYLSSMSDDCGKNLDKIREFMVRGVEHFIILGTPVGYREIEETINAAGKIVVATSTSFQRHVAVDIGKGASALVRFLLDKGGWNFRLVVLEQDFSPNSDRIRALCEQLPGVPFPEIQSRYIRTIKLPEKKFIDVRGMGNYSDSAYQAGYQLAEELWASEPEISAVSCHFDLTALGIAGWLVKHGKIIGKDVLIGGFNNDHAVRNSPFPISSVDHDWNTRGNLLLEAALDPGECRKLLDPKVYIREYKDAP